MKTLIATALLVAACQPAATPSKDQCRRDSDCFSEERCHLDPKGGNFCLVDFAAKARSGQ